jgi:hypothetical protein
LSPNGRTLFLVDADNVSVDVIREALQLKIESLVAVHVRRCYCSADFAVKNLEFLKEHSIRAMVNATAGKNCTDIALAVDAVQLCSGERPSVVVIVASDSDFAPLVLHLRELGCRVEGVGQEGKTGAESPRVYDAFLELPASRRRAAKAARPPARRVDTRSPPQRSPAELPAELAGVLAALPQLEAGNPVELRIAAEALRKAGLLARNASSTRLFKRYPDAFVLAPAAQPNTVRLRLPMR